MSLLKAAATLVSFVITLQAASIESQHHVETATEQRQMEHEFSGVREYKAFHDVLHPLQHEARPNKDFKTMRARANELVTTGRAVVKVGVPKSVKAKGVNTEYDFAKKLGAFKSALAQFKNRAKKGSDAKLEEAFDGVHESFETLARMIPNVPPKK